MHQTQLNINGSTVERVPTYKYLGVNIAEDMKWDQHISSVVKKSRQRLYHLRKLRQFNISVELRRTFYCSTVESVLSGCLTVWYGNATERDKKALRRVVRCAERITGTTLLYPEELYKKSCVRRAQQIMADIHHPHHDLFQWLPSGRRLRSLKVCWLEAGCSCWWWLFFVSQFGLSLTPDWINTGTCGRRPIKRSTRNEAEEMARRALWEKKLMQVNIHNLEESMGLHTYTQGINHLSDLTKEELQQMYAPLKLPKDFQMKPTPLNASVKDVPDTVDWRDAGLVTKVKDQPRRCGTGPDQVCGKNPQGVGFLQEQFPGDQTSTWCYRMNT
ncbi:hypothetical protein WMY93_026557 [Mugilogobius chulae]|uniref:Cathepsin propeptide inhibitor domain-containing protein n=1 Tax=Mugilogobius chulae TaxID=88201 RepID=A0AAW0MXV1_9GOBI